MTARLRSKAAPPSARIALAAALGALAASEARAVRPLTPQAPEFPMGSVWINTEDLSLKRLARRRVVLVSFINFSSLNSIRTLGALKAWWERYSQEGLMVVGVHDPDYGSDRDLNWVRANVRRYALRFPVVVDNDRTLWKAYGNEGWPAHYLIDHRGLIVHDRIGEGGYRELEAEILEALERFNRYRPPPGQARVEDPPAQECGESTPLRYAGASRGQQTSLEGIRETQRTLVANRDGELSYRGKWGLEPEALRLARDNPALNDYVRLIYRGAEAVAFMESASRRKITVFLKQDDIWLHANNAGPDVQWDISDRSFVVVSGPRLYYLTRNPNDNIHELLLHPAEEGVGVHGFEFSNSCQTHYEHK